MAPGDPGEVSPEAVDAYFAPLEAGDLDFAAAAR